MASYSLPERQEGATPQPTTANPTDDELLSYLDGELTADRAAAVERAMDADPEIAAKLSVILTVSGYLRQTTSNALLDPESSDGRGQEQGPEDPTTPSR
jgi:anti-sigma factor RsiW